MTRPTLPRRHRLITLVGVVLSALSIAAGPAVAAPQTAAPNPTVGSGNTELVVGVSGTFSGQNSGPGKPVVGTVNPAALGFVAIPENSPASTYTFTATCHTADGTQCAAGTTATWTFGGGVTVTGTYGVGVTHTYREPGRYTVTSTVTDPDGHNAMATTNALVSPGYSDVAQESPQVRQAVRVTSALALLPQCKTYAVNTGGGESTAGRPKFCPRPKPGGQVPELTFNNINPAPNNGPGSANCFGRATNCGLPAVLFAGEGGNPLDPCGTSCQASLVTNGLAIEQGGQAHLVYQPDNCSDNHAARTLPGGGVSLIEGVEAGCATRAGFMSAILTLTGATADASGAVSADVCPTSGQATTVTRRAAAVLSGGTISPCYPGAALTKGDAYRMLAGVVATAAGDAFPLTFIDLPDMSLGHGTQPAPYPYASALQKTLDVGIPLVGSTTCPASTQPGLCFNPFEALTRADAAVLLAGALAGHPHPTAITADVSVDRARLTVGDTTIVRMSLQAADWASPLTKTWFIAAGGGIAILCSPTFGTLTAGAPETLCLIRATSVPAGGQTSVTVTVGSDAHMFDLSVTAQPTYTLGGTGP